MVKRIEIPNTSLFSVFSTFQFIDSWALRIMVSTEGDIDPFKETIHSLAKFEWAFCFTMDSTFAFKDEK
jgi:hypothetical protein